MTERSKKIGFFCFAIVVSIYFCFLSINSYKSQGFFGDFTAIWQSVYNTGASAVPYSSFNCSVPEFWSLDTFQKMLDMNKPLDTCHQLSVHAHFLTYPLGVLSTVFTSPFFLLVIQAFAFGMFSFFIGLYGLKQKLSLTNIFAIMLLFSISPFTTGLILNDFHFDAFSGVVFAIFVVLFPKFGWIGLGVWTLFALLVKESFVALPVGLGLYLILQNKKEYKKSAALIFIGVAGFVFLTKYFIPSFSESKTFMFGGIYGSEMGASLTEIIINSIKNPIRFMNAVATPANGEYLLSLILFGTMLPLLSPSMLLIVSGFFFINLMSTNVAMKMPWGQYNAAVICVWFLACIDGFKNLDKLIKNREVKIVLLGVIFLASICMSLNKYGSRFILKPEMPNDDYVFLRSLPKDKSVCAEDRISNFVADRLALYVFPVNVGKCDLIILNSMEVSPWYLKKEIWQDSLAYIAKNYTLVKKTSSYSILEKNPL